MQDRAAWELHLRGQAQMTFDAAVKAAGQNGYVYRYFIGIVPGIDMKLKTEWFAECDYSHNCGRCGEAHIYITQDATDRNDFQDSIMAREVCITEALIYDDWEVRTEVTPELIDWVPPNNS